MHEYTSALVGDLVREIAYALELDSQWSWSARCRDPHAVSAARSAGRAAGRHLHTRVRTSTIEQDDTTVVTVWLRFAPEADRVRWAEREYRRGCHS